MGVATPTILSDGTAMDPAYQLLSLETLEEVNRIASATLTLLDGDASLGAFPITDDAFFQPGKEVEIKLGYESEEDQSIFKGVVIRQRILTVSRGTQLMVDLKGAAVKMTQTRQSMVYSEQTDDQIISDIIAQAGLTVGEITATQPTHVEMVRYASTDWDFILSRADIHGLAVTEQAGEVSARKLTTEGSAALSLEYGIDEIYAFEMEVDAGTQYSSVESIAWDSKSQQMTQASQAADFPIAQGDLDGATLAEAVGFTQPLALASPSALTPEELQALADGRMARSRMSMIRGRITLAGTGTLKLLDLIELAGMGARFSGSAPVTGIRHQLDDEGWQTDLQLGISSRWFCRNEAVNDAPAAGLLPAANGLQIGIIESFEEDPDGEYRLKVQIPGFNSEQAVLWARLATPDAGQGRGFFFRPETGDEVVVGFLDDDPRQAVVMGSLFSSTNAPPDTLTGPTEENNERAIISRLGHCIKLVDEPDGAIKIETAAANQVVLDDTAQEIRLEDQHGNLITMNQDGITLKSSKDLTFEASGNVAIEGSQVDVK